MADTTCPAVAAKSRRVQGAALCRHSAVNRKVENRQHLKNLFSFNWKPRFIVEDTRELALVSKEAKKVDFGDILFGKGVLRRRRYRRGDDIQKIQIWHHGRQIQTKWQCEDFRKSQNWWYYLNKPFSRGIPAKFSKKSWQVSTSEREKLTKVSVLKNIRNDFASLSHWIVSGDNCLTWTNSLACYCSCEPENHTDFSQEKEIC